MLIILQINRGRQDTESLMFTSWFTSSPSRNTKQTNTWWINHIHRSPLSWLLWNIHRMYSLSVINRSSPLLEPTALQTIYLGSLSPALICTHTHTVPLARRTTGQMMDVHAGCKKDKLLSLLPEKLHAVFFWSLLKQQCFFLHNALKKGRNVFAFFVLQRGRV